MSLTSGAVAKLYKEDGNVDFQPWLQVKFFKSLVLIYNRSWILNKFVHQVEMVLIVIGNKAFIVFVVLNLF